MATQEPPFDRLIEGLRAGDPQVLHAFMQQYRPALERLAATRIQDGLRRRVGPETIALSVCRTFLRRARAGQFELADGDSLWGLLCAIALTKVREQVRFHRRQRRSVEREVPLDRAVGEVAGPDGARVPVEVAFAEQLEQELDALDDEERLILDLRLREQTLEDIAAVVPCSERTVRRILKRIETRLRSAFESQ